MQKRVLAGKHGSFHGGRTHIRGSDETQAATIAGHAGAGARGGQPAAHFAAPGGHLIALLSAVSCSAPLHAHVHVAVPHAGPVGVNRVEGLRAGREGGAGEWARKGGWAGGSAGLACHVRHATRACLAAQARSPCSPTHEPATHPRSRAATRNLSGKPIKQTRVNPPLGQGPCLPCRTCPPQWLQCCRRWPGWSRGCTARTCRLQVGRAGAAAGGAAVRGQRA